MNKKFKILLFLFSSIIVFITCKNETDPIYCHNAKSDFFSQTFIGEIVICNGDSAKSENINASASISTIDENNVLINLKSNNSLIDTIFTFSLTCKVLQETVPVISFIDSLGNQKGQYNKTPDRISFEFNYINCNGNTGFLGYAN